MQFSKLNHGARGMCIVAATFLFAAAEDDCPFFGLGEEDCSAREAELAQSWITEGDTTSS